MGRMATLRTAITGEEMCFTMLKMSMFDWGIVATNKKKNFHHEAGNPYVAIPRFP